MKKQLKRSPALIKAQSRYRDKLKESGLDKKPVTVLFTIEELERLDTERADESRNAYIRRNILGN